MHRTSKKQWKTDVWGWLLVSPLVLGLLIFTAYPLVSSVIYSFYDKSLRVTENFGLQNYAAIFSVAGEFHEEFFHALWVTIKYTVISVPLGLVLGYSLALFLCAKIKGNKWLLTLYYLSSLIPAVVSGRIWANIIDVNYGIVNTVLMRLGLKGISFTSPENLLPAYIWLTTFGIGGGSIVWCAGISSVDPNLYEAASLDGAGKIKRFFFVTLPMTTPYIFYNLIMGMIGSLQLFNGPYVLTGDASGGAGNALQTVEMSIYYTMFQRQRYGVASAMAWILCVIIGFLTLFTFKSNKWVQYGDD